ncbi:MAG: DNA/RNA non-specific endonuclease [Gemmatimonadaceae bacterium]|nr:DNA/RNA non-specific endonuclease [Gemmatimonadaceae bacterium]
MTRIRFSRFLLPAIAVVVLSCSTDGPTSPRDSVSLLPAHNQSLTAPAVRISEIHYDNTGTDAGEAIEISGPAGTDVTGWTLVLYNGSTGASYTPLQTFSGTIPATCGARGVLVKTYPVNGIQNGSPDAVALVDAAGQVVEFLSYEGVFVAAGGAANGMTSTDIGVSENGTEPLGLSLQRVGDGTWNTPAASSFGSCNDAAEPPPPAIVASVTISPAAPTLVVSGTTTLVATAYDPSNAPIAGVSFTWSSSAPDIATVSGSGVVTALAAGSSDISAAAPNGVSATASVTVEDAPPTELPDVVVSELHYDNDGADINEGFEIEGPAGTNVNGWSVVLYNQTGGASYATVALTGTIASQCDGRGTLSFPFAGIQNGASDGWALVAPDNRVIEFRSYEGTLTATNGPAAGLTSTDIGVSESASASTTRSLQRARNGVWYGPYPASMGSCNPAEPPPPVLNIAFSGRNSSDPALPIGFQDQLFATLRDGTVTLTTTFTWSSDTPAIASIDANGVVTALAEGSAILRATAADGTTATWTLPIRTGSFSASASYVGNTEFGDPTDADASDDFIIRRPQYTTSYSRARNIPNWVAYNLEQTHFGPEDRCDCFTYDPQLPSDFPRYTTADYTGAAAINGYSIDRGHLARSFDRTAGSLDNAATFLFSNIIPQASDNNQGPWASLENDLGAFAQSGDREVYIIAGASGSKGTVKNEGRITIPEWTWKVAVVVPRDRRLADITRYSDLEVIAVVMPNENGIRNTPWTSFKVTVDSVESLSGYDVLALLPDQIEVAVESGTHPPVAAVNGPWIGNEGSSISLSAAASTDADGDMLSYAWNFGDGTFATGVSATKTWTQNGIYAVRMVVTDVRGLVDSVVTTATIANVAPSVSALPNATLLPGEIYAASGTFADPGADSWLATVDFGEGAGQVSLPLSGFGFSFSNTYAAAGVFTVTVRVSDGEAIAASSATVTVLSDAQSIARAIALVEGLPLNAGNINSLRVKLKNALKQIERENFTPGVNMLEALLNEVDAFEQSGRLTNAQAAPLRDLVTRLITSLLGRV